MNRHHKQAFRWHALVGRGATFFVATFVAGICGAYLHTSPATAANPGLTVVGHTPATPQLYDGSGGGPGNTSTYAQSNLLLDPPMRRGYQVLTYTLPSLASVTEIDALDLDSLRTVRTATFAGLGMPVTNEFMAQSAFPVALAPGPRPRLVAISSRFSSGYPPYSLVTIDLTSMTVTGSVAVASAASQCLNPFPTPCPIFGVSYDAPSGLVYVLTADREGSFTSAAAEFTLSLVTIDPAKSAVVNRTTLPQVCDGPPSVSPGSAGNLDTAPIFRSTDGQRVWTACATSRNNGSGGIVSAVSVPVDPATGVPTQGQVGTGISVYPSIPYIVDVYADPGSDRMFFRSMVSGDHGLVVFDARHHAFVGLVSLDRLRYTSSGAPLVAPADGDGVDPSTGRFYFVALDKIYLVDGRRTTREGFPQATVLPTDGQGRYGARGVVVDPPTHHVFVMYGSYAFDGARSNSTDTSYTVYRDDVPVSGDTPLANLDGNTNDIPTSAQTLSIFSGHAQGFGARTFLLDPPDIGGYGSGMNTKVGGVRDALYGLVGAPQGIGAGIDLSNGGSEGTGYTAAADQVTRSAYPDAYVDKALPYPYKVVACHDTTGKADTEASSDPGGHTSGTCDLANQATRVESFVGPSGMSRSYGVPAPSIASVEMSTDVHIDPARKTAAGVVPVVVSTATAVVRGIDLAPGITIDAVTISATAIAGGRSGTASTSVTRSISGVRAGSQSCDSCDLSSALHMINLTLQQDFPGQAQVVLPGVDAEAAAGTPHGYYAAVYKDRYQYLNDGVINVDFRPELIGLEEVRNNDNVFVGEQARQVTELGGVEVESRYGITVPPPGDNPAQGGGGASLGAGGDGSGPGTDTGLGAAAGTIGNAGATPPPLGLGGRILAFLRQVLEGLAAFTDLHQLPLMATVWTLLVLPGYLATRRRRLEKFGL